MILLCTFQHPLKMNRAFQPNLLKMLVRLKAKSFIYWVTEFVKNACSAGSQW
jgi:hypothetical protein